MADGCIRLLNRVKYISFHIGCSSIERQYTGRSIDPDSRKLWGYLNTYDLPFFSSEGE
jgi:hypothetical protein